MSRFTRRRGRCARVVAAAEAMILAVALPWLGASAAVPGRAALAEHEPHSDLALVDRVVAGTRTTTDPATDPGLAVTEAAPDEPPFTAPAPDSGLDLTAGIGAPAPAPRDRRPLWLGLGLGLGATGVAGMAVLGGGLHLERQRQQQLDAVRAAGIDLRTVDLAPLDAQGRRARVMITVGAISGPAGLLVGGALLGLALGSRPSAMSSRRASLRLLPTTGGVRISGRF